MLRFESRTTHDGNQPPGPAAPTVDGANRDTARAKLLDRILQNPRIPSPPTFALQVFEKTGRVDCTVNEISDLLAHDPGMSAKILKALNSAHYGRSRPITNVRQAVTLLGNRPLRSLVLGLALPAMQSGVQADAGLRRYWRSSIAGAVMARELATRHKFSSPDDEFVASLLRDLGMILLHQVFPQEYRPMWSEGVAGDQCEWEERVIGVNHAEVSAALLERWRLPPEIVDAVRFHHRPDFLAPLGEQLAGRGLLLYFSGQLADLEDRAQEPKAIEAILQTAKKHYGLDREGLEEFLGTVGPRIDEVSTILGVDIGECPDFDEFLTTGCEQLVQASLQAAESPEEKVDDRATASDSIRSKGRDLVNDPESIVPGSRLLQYEVVEVIGRGAMGVVLKAFDPGLARHVAIKVLAPEMAGSEKARQRFALEARFAAALRHEHVVAIYAVHELDGVPFLVMEFVQGSSLEGLVEGGRTFSVAEIARIGRQSALGLSAAHTARLIHRDVKPANILVEDGTLHARVADFGLARAVDEDFHLSQPGLLLGTPSFMSPEQVDGKPLTPATDLFSLGSVLYVLCTGQLPFQAETLSPLLHAIADRTPTPIRSLNSTIPEDLAVVIEKLHAKDPTRRFPSAAAVAEGLAAWCE